MDCSLIEQALFLVFLPMVLFSLRGTMVVCLERNHHSMAASVLSYVDDSIDPLFAVDIHHHRRRHRRHFLSLLHRLQYENRIHGAVSHHKCDAMVDIDCVTNFLYRHARRRANYLCLGHHHLPNCCRDLAAGRDFSLLAVADRLPNSSTRLRETVRIPRRVHNVDALRGRIVHRCHSNTLLRHSTTIPPFLTEA